MTCESWLKIGSGDVPCHVSMVYQVLYAVPEAYRQGVKAGSLYSGKGLSMVPSNEPVRIAETTF